MRPVLSALLLANRFELIRGLRRCLLTILRPGVAGSNQLSPVLTGRGGVPSAIARKMRASLRRIRLGGSGESRGKISRKGGVACVAPPRPHVASRRWPESLRREKRGDPKSRTKRSLLSSHAILHAQCDKPATRSPRSHVSRRRCMDRRAAGTRTTTKIPPSLTKHPHPPR